MNQDYSVQFLKLVGKSFAWIAGLAFITGVFLSTQNTYLQENWAMVGLFITGFAIFYSAIPVAIFAGFVVTLRAFGRKP